MVKNFIIRQALLGQPFRWVMLLCMRWHSYWYLKLQNGIYFSISIGMWQHLPLYSHNAICWKDLPNDHVPLSLKSLPECSFFFLSLHNLKPWPSCQARWSQRISLREHAPICLSKQEQSFSGSVGVCMSHFSYFSRNWPCNIFWLLFPHLQVAFLHWAPGLHGITSQIRYHKPMSSVA